MDVEGGMDLVPVTVWNTHNDDVVTIAKKLMAPIMQSKRSENKEHNNATKIVGFLPSYMVGMIASTVSYLTLCAGISLPMFGVSAFSL